jgi:hypothetical protein
MIVNETVKMKYLSDCETRILKLQVTACTV